MISRDVTVTRFGGLHARVAARVVEIAKRHHFQVRVSYEDSPKADASSIMQLLLLGAEQGKAISIEAEGDDEGQAVDAIADYFEGGLGI